MHHGIPVIRLAALCGLLLAFPVLAQDNVVNPADKQRRPTTPPGEQGTPVVVEGRQVSNLREEDRIGSYQQPEWTSHRRFMETRVYVRPEGQADFEYWLIPEIDDKGHTETKQQYEFEFGLPNRFQFDLYLVSHQQGNTGPMEFDETKFEVRYALADWDEIWGNPTLYLEWAAKNDAPDGIEGKLLLGGEISEGWHWGANLVYEAETGGARERNVELTAGVSYTAIDSKLSIGAETKYALTDDKTDRGDYANEFLLGPSVQYRPMPNTHLDLAALAGLNNDSPDAKFIFVFGWEF
ncbi:MAG: transporter [Planctomycetota bacterium]